MTKVTISRKGQISIPKSIREQLNLKPGSQLSLDVHGEHLVLRRLAPGFPDWRTMRGMLRGGANLQENLPKERAAELARDDARFPGL
jgi:AbrB family looped-hinge helix DNA binding protein